jgi:hypothetical protein
MAPVKTSLLSLLLLAAILPSGLSAPVGDVALARRQLAGEGAAADSILVSLAFMTLLILANVMIVRY